MISVALCTYNGSKYLNQQLRSIALQTRPVDEIVICDDGSTDNTLEIIEQYSKEVNYPVYIFQNSTNLGSTKNFERCLTLCNGDIIFLSDQDDAWYPDKVEKMMEVFEKQPKIDAVFSNAMVMNGNSNPIGRTIWDEIEFIPTLQSKWKEGKAYEILYNNFVVTGATMAVRKSALNAAMPFPLHIKDFIHDAWMAMWYSLDNAIAFIEEPLMYYRIHESQQVGFGGKEEYVTLKDRFSRDRALKLAPLREKADTMRNLYEELKLRRGQSDNKLVVLKNRMQHFQMRSTLPDNKLLRLYPVIKDLIRGRYRFSSKDWWLPVLGDIIE